MLGPAKFVGVEQSRAGQGVAGQQLLGAQRTGGRKKSGVCGQKGKEKLPCRCAFFCAMEVSDTSQECHITERRFTGKARQGRLDEDPVLCQDVHMSTDG